MDHHTDGYAGGRVRCTGCSQEVSEEEAQATRWAHWASGTGELHPYCSVCAERTFGLPGGDPHPHPGCAVQPDPPSPDWS